MANKMNEFKTFRLSSEINESLDRLKKQYGTKSESEIIRKIILEHDQALLNKENECKKLIESKDNEIKALYIKIGELQSELNKPMWQRLFGKRKAI